MNVNLSAAIDRFAASFHSLADEQLARPWQWGDYDEGVRFAFFRVYESLRHLSARLWARRAERAPASTAQLLLGNYHTAFRDLQAVHLGVDDELARAHPAPGEWSLQNSLAHMIDADLSFWFLNQHALQQRRQGVATPHRPVDEEWQGLVAREAFFQIAEEGPLSALLACHASLNPRVLEAFEGAANFDMQGLASLLHGDQIRVRRSAHKVRFLHPRGWSYYATLRRKLRWYEGVV